jgi:hypothetical protein
MKLRILKPTAVLLRSISVTTPRIVLSLRPALEVDCNVDDLQSNVHHCCICYGCLLSHVHIVPVNPYNILLMHTTIIPSPPSITQYIYMCKLCFLSYPSLTVRN